MDEHIGVPRDRAAEIVGVEVRRLGSWASNDLVIPSILGRVGSRNYYSYSLDDLVQGRIVCEIEDRGVDIRRIKAFVDHLRNDEHPRPLASLRWGTGHGEVFAMYPDDSWVGGRRFNQTVITEFLDLDRIRVEARKAALLRPAQPGGVEKRRGVLGSKEVFAGTRVPVSSVQTYLERGYGMAAILAEYPDLEAADIEEARRRLAG